MYYISTRGTAPVISSKEAILKGIAEDNGLYVPVTFPFFGPNPFSQIRENSYAARAARILREFFTDYTEIELSSACQIAYAENFKSSLTAPVKFFGNGIAVLELWHGPTLAFKDIALQLMPHLLSLALPSGPEEHELIILVATSGDTGKAALEGFAGVKGVKIFVFYPHEGVSEIQRLQMVTQRGSNIGVCAVKGNFDDTQSAVKQIFSAPAINNKLAAFNFKLSSANSINWGRLAPQIVYYFTAYNEMVKANKIRQGQSISICVPTGNFGNLLAAYYATQCGLPVSRLICASNLNRVLTDFLQTGVYDRRREFFKTDSPSMDILISSNLERLLFELSRRNSAKVSEWMEQLAARGWYNVPGEVRNQLQSMFFGGFAGPAETLQAIREVFEKEKYLIDPHTAVGYSVLKSYRERNEDHSPALLASTASPFKFSRAVLEALGRPGSPVDEFSLLDDLSNISGLPVPEKLAELKTLPEIHLGVCEKQEMSEVLFEFLGVH